ncbi:DNA replication complex subunit Gins51 [Thermococcus sp.]
MDIVKLRELLEAELSSTDLISLDEEFYKEFDSLVKALELGAESSSDVEGRLYNAQLHIAGKIVREIIRIRLHKIVDLAIEGKPYALTEEEKKIFRILSAFINREGIPVEIEESIEEIHEEIESKSVPRDAYLIKIDLPKILDENMNEHGPFRAGDLVTLPKSIGEILKERDAADKITIKP